MNRWLGAAAFAAALIGLAIVGPSLYSRAAFNDGVAPMLLLAWACFALFAVSSLAIGTFVLRLTHGNVKPDGYWALSFAAGIGVFALCDGFFSWFHLIGPRFFFLLPLTLLAIGLPTLAAELSVWRPRPLNLSPIETLALVFAAVCLGLLVIQTVSPDNVNYDAAWYHLRAAERYALAGGMMRSVEGDMLLTLPQTASWLYTWAFCWPNVLIDERIRLALLLELGTVLGTLAAIPALTRALMPNLPAQSTRLAWVALFFFPSIFIYDTGIMGGADHVVALWSVTTIITWFQARRSLQRGPWVLFGLNVACLLAKYSSLYVLIPLVVVVAIDWLSRIKQTRSLGPVLAAFVALVLTAPYWLRNIIWYHNPVYPAASHLFHNAPWNIDADVWNAALNEGSDWTENGIFSHRLKVTVQALFNYDINVNTWGDMVGNQPVAGPAYFISLLALPFVSARKRLLVLAFIVHVGIAVWYNTHQHQFRYLTVLFAPMAAATAAVALSLWRDGWLLGKAAVLVVVGFVLAAFGDVPFRKTHRMAGGQSIIGVAESFIARHGTRSGRYSGWESAGNAMPPNALPLVHGGWIHLGLGRQSVTDYIPLQFGINYAEWGSISSINNHLKDMGITHLIYTADFRGSDSVTGEALFQGLARQTVDKKSANGFNIGELPQAPHELGDGILYLGCHDVLTSGLYTLDALKFPIVPRYHAYPQPPMMAPAEGDGQALLPRATYVAIENDCPVPDPPSSLFALGSDMNEWPVTHLRIFVRTAGHAQL